MKPLAGSVVWTVSAVLLFASAASAQGTLDDRDRSVDGPVEESARQGLFVPALIAPANARDSGAVAYGLAGYDGARDVAVMQLIGDIALIGPIDLRLGIGYAPSAPDAEGDAQPHAGLRLKLFEQSRAGIDAAIALFYRMERFTDDEGLVQGVFALGRRWGRVGTFAHVAYGQDPEADDREAEVSFATLYQVGADLQLGFETHARFDLFSNDPKREAREDSELDLVAGPLVQYAAGPMMLMAQAGVSANKVEHYSAGALALAGIGSAY